MEKNDVVVQNHLAVLVAVRARHVRGPFGGQPLAHVHAPVAARSVDGRLPVQSDLVAVGVSNRFSQ